MGVIGHVTSMDVKIHLPGYMIESKTTVHDSMSVSTDVRVTIV